jgi:5-methyltetrahydropteroyltriglutamate--homocysteine methyltransferase
MRIPTEPIGSVPRPEWLLRAIAEADGHDTVSETAFDEAVRDTLLRFEDTGSPVATDGEQRKYESAFTYPLRGAENVRPDGFRVPFGPGEPLRLPRLVRGPFRYTRPADVDLARAQRLTRLPMKQAVISPAALSLVYPEQPIEGYSRETFLEDLVREHVREVRACLAAGAQTVQIDLIEGRLALSLDPTGTLLHRFIDLDNLALARLTAAERMRIGLHVCANGDLGAAPETDYTDVLRSVFSLDVGRFYVALAGASDRQRVLETIRTHRQPHHEIYVGVVAPHDPRLETKEEIRDRVLEASEHIPVTHLGTTDDCGFAPVANDGGRSRELAFEKIRARVRGTALASEALQGRVS